jgi:hypothetical protein
MTRNLFLTVWLCWAAAGPAAAQETINYASVSGRVTDQQGEVVPGAAVTARQTQTNVTAMATTDQDGRFRFPFLRRRHPSAPPPGKSRAQYPPSTQSEHRPAPLWR